MGGRPPDYANYMRARSSDAASQQGTLQASARNTATRAPRGQAAQNRPYPLTFVVDHLATFGALSRQGRVLSPQDGVSQFRQMAQKTGVWILRVRLVVSEKELVVLEGDTGGEVMETFPISQVSRPAACLDPNETHDNILLFTVLPDPRTSGGMDTISSSTGAAATPEIHFFQCTDASAQDVVDLIIAAKTGRLKSPSSSSSSQPVRPVESGPSSRTKEFEQAAQRTADAVHVYRQRAPAEGQGRRTAVQTDVSTGERAVHWVELLNRCFDDIERFMGRLQAVADAYRELEERRKKGRDNRKDRMLTLKMNIRKNPSHEEFVDIFQKFRLSFNLLAVLRHHIHDPNAPELVHFLFTPLSLVLEASQDPMVEQSRGDGRAGTAARVREPPLSAGAVELLANCLTSKEIELWRILAETWTVPARSGYATSYVPRFYDGWSPPPAWLDGLYDDATSGHLNQPIAIAAAPVPMHVVDHMAYGMHPYHSMPMDMGRSNGRGNIWQDPHLIGSIDRQAHLREAPPPPQGNWSVNRLVPNAYKSQVQPQGGVTLPTNHASAAAVNKRTDRKPRYYEVMKNRITNKSDEISVQKGEIVEVLENKNSFWKITNNRGQTGYVPKTCLQPYFGNLQII